MKFYRGGEDGGERINRRESKGEREKSSKEGRGGKMGEERERISDCVQDRGIIVLIPQMKKKRLRAGAEP